MKNWTDRWITKKVVLLFSLTITGVFFASIWFLTSFICSPDVIGNCRLYKKVIDQSTVITIWGPVSLLFFLAALKLPNTAFARWARFSIWWIPLSFTATLLASDRHPANILSISDREIVGFVCLILYALISVGVIIRGFWQMHVKRS